jgi:hypothetical protein
MNIRHPGWCYWGASVVGKMVGKATLPNGTVLPLVVAVVIVPFWSDFAKDNWNCMRITRYVVTAPTICKSIHW